MVTGPWSKCSSGSGKPQKGQGGKPVPCGCGGNAWCLNFVFVANYTGTYPDGVSRPCVLSQGDPGSGSDPEIIGSAVGNYRDINPQVVTYTLIYLRALVFTWQSPVNLGVTTWENVHTESGPDGVFNVWAIARARVATGSIGGVFCPNPDKLTPPLTFNGDCAPLDPFLI